MLGLTGQLGVGGLGNFVLGTVRVGAAFIPHRGAANSALTAPSLGSALLSPAAASSLSASGANSALSASGAQSDITDANARSTLTDD